MLSKCEIGENHNTTFLIEVHDFFSCGLYGLRTMQNIRQCSTGGFGNTYKEKWLINIATNEQIFRNIEKLFDMVNINGKSYSGRNEYHQKR